jgi:molybdopterin-guanine dinucleotide biosynthesis protein A
MAGGGSSRFGRDKALVELGGKPMLARMAGLLQNVTKSVNVVAASGKYDAFGFGVVADCWPNEGPLGGIITALENTAVTDPGCEWNLIVSCDMPFLTEALLKYLIGRAEASAADVVLPRSAGGPEPLCACWRTGAVKTLRPAFERSVRKVMDGVKQLKAEILDETDWKRFDSAGRLFWNMNTAEDFEEVRRVWERNQP